MPRTADLTDRIGRILDLPVDSLPPIQPVVVVDGNAGWPGNPFVCNQVGVQVPGIAGISLSADAANPSVIELTNPAGSGVWVSFTQATVSVGTADLISYALTGAQTLTPSLSNITPSDRRLDGRVALQIASGRTVPAITAQLGALRFAANAPFTVSLHGQLVLIPGTSLTIFTNSNNIALEVNATWVERRIRIGANV